MKKVIIAAEAREAATKAKKALKDRKKHPQRRRPAGQAHGLHHPRSRRSRSCSWSKAIPPAARPRDGRDRITRPSSRLRGKVLNVEKARLENLLNNEEICEPHLRHRHRHRQHRGRSARLRYGKIIILTDADVDGQHIRTLLLTSSIGRWRKLVADGTSTSPARRFTR